MTLRRLAIRVFAGGLLASTTAVWAQSPEASIVGTVKDPSGDRGPGGSALHPASETKVRTRSGLRSGGRAVGRKGPLPGKGGPQDPRRRPPPCSLPGSQ
jgi:hypothetical protein